MADPVAGRVANSGEALSIVFQRFHTLLFKVKLQVNGARQGRIAILLQGALQVYTGPRYIEGESCLSASVRAERGIMAGCPFAVGLSKLALHPVMQKLRRHPALSHLDLFVDDAGYDVEHNQRNVQAMHTESGRRFKAQFKLICQ